MKSNFRRNTQKRKNKVNRKSSKITGARGTKRTFCRKAKNKTNKKRGTYKKNESVVDIQTRKK